ncbi:MAG TPA: chemotaxis protein CheB [Lysobacter sp.]
MTEPRRVALLARPGAALDRMRGALGDAGARIVLEADPTRIEPAVLSDASAEVVLVVLDPATEEAIDRFDSVLGDPSIEVIFEEAEHALTREGWDAARWVRHLAAKLYRHADVLPPRRDDATWESAVAPFTAEGGLALAELTPVVIDQAAAALDDIRLDDIVLADVALDDLAQGSAGLDDVALDGIAFDGVALDDISLGGTASDDIALEGVTFDDTSLGGTSLEGFGGGLTLEVSEMELVAPHYDAGERAGSGETADELTFTLPDFEAAAPTTADSHGESDRFRRDLDDLESRIATMGLIDDRAVHLAATGAVLVMAGIGGPDAVRQLLGALPEGFPRPVLVQQRLDGGRYDRLVTQMQRATTLPVKLAEPGMRASAGEIYILAAEVGVSGSDDGIVFNDRPAEVLSSLPTADSAVLLLSGADAAVVDAVLNQSWSGALVAGQSPEGCYDAAATNALIARGGTAGQPAELARRLVARWPA